MKRLPWMTAAFVALCALADGNALQYERSGETWRLLTGQMVHWTPRMAFFDLGMLLGLGAWLEVRGDRRLAAVSLALGAVLTAVAIHLSPDLLVYRGSSGIASTLFVLAAFRIADAPDPWNRTLALAAVALFLGKAAFETLSGQALFAGELPEGVKVVPLVHLLGGLAGAAHLAQRSGPVLRTRIQWPPKPTLSSRTAGDRDTLGPPGASTSSSPMPATCDAATARSGARTPSCPLRPPSWTPPPPSASSTASPRSGP